MNAEKPSSKIFRMALWKCSTFSCLNRSHAKTVPILYFRIQISINMGWIRQDNVQSGYLGSYRRDDRKITLFSPCVNVIAAKSHYIAIINNNFNMSNEFLYLPAGHVPDRFWQMLGNNRLVIAQYQKYCHNDERLPHCEPTHTLRDKQYSVYKIHL